jgi:hypothetical protein
MAATIYPFPITTEQRDARREHYAKSLTQLREIYGDAFGTAVFPAATVLQLTPRNRKTA